LNRRDWLGRTFSALRVGEETHSYLIRKLAYLEAFQSGVRNHLATFKQWPPKKIVPL
jgi:hypothetical protein